MTARFTYEANYTGDGKSGCIADSQTEFRAYVDRDDVWTEAVDQVAEAVVALLNENAASIPVPEWSEDDDV